MPRFARVVAGGCPHHITHRSNRMDEIFFSDEDRAEYLDILLDYTGRYGVDIWVILLMTTHVHLNTGTMPSPRGRAGAVWPAKE